MQSVRITNCLPAIIKYGSIDQVSQAWSGEALALFAVSLAASGMSGYGRGINVEENDALSR